MKEWITFWFEGNLFFGYVTSSADWQEKVVGPYKDVGIDIKELKRAKTHRCGDGDDGVPRFGFYSEYFREPTLGDWAEENGIKL